MKNTSIAVPSDSTLSNISILCLEVKEMMRERKAMTHFQWIHLGHAGKALTLPI